MILMMEFREVNRCDSKNTPDGRGVTEVVLVHFERTTGSWQEGDCICSLIVQIVLLKKVTKPLQLQVITDFFDCIVVSSQMVLKRNLELFSFFNQSKNIG